MGKPHDSYPEITEPVIVKYCPHCTLPGDFCIHGPCWEKCKPWCMENCPEYYPELSGISLEDAKTKAAAAIDKARNKEKPGGKVQRAASPHVNIKKMTRGGRKCITSVSGMEGFGVNLDDAAKSFKKKFACGSAVVKGECGQPDSVDIQGDFEDEVIDMICDVFKKVPRDKITCEFGGSKRGGKKNGPPSG